MLLISDLNLEGTYNRTILELKLILFLWPCRADYL